MRTFPSRNLFHVLLATSLLAALSGAPAAIRTWSGLSGSNDDFGQTSNWVGNVAPNSFDDLVFTGTAPRLQPWQSYGSFTDFGALTFNAGAAAYLIRGNPIGVNGVITNNSGTLQTMGAGNDMAFRTNGSINAVNGDILFNTTNAYLDISTLNITTSAGRTVTFNANTNVRNGGSQGTAGLTTGGSGLVVFNRNADLNGATIVNGGTLRFVNSRVSNASNYAIASGAVLEFNVTGASSIVMDGHNGSFTGSGTLAKTGSGSMYLGGNVGGNVKIQQSAGGLVDVQQGTLRNDYGRDNWSGNLGSLRVASGAVVDTWDGINGITVNALTGSGTVQHTNYNTSGTVTANLTVGVANGSGTFNGILTDADGGGGGGQHFLGLVKNGTGTQTLTGSNTYRGATTVSAGTLLINGNQTAANGVVTVATTGTLGGSGVIGGATTINGTLSPGNSPGLLTFANGLTLTSSATTIMQIDGTSEGVTYDSLDITGALVYGGVLSIDFGFFPVLNSTFNLFDFTSQSGSFSSVVFVDAGYAGSFNTANGVLTVTSVPEPATVTLIGLGLSLALGRRRSRRSQAEI